MKYLVLGRMKMVFDLEILLSIMNYIVNLTIDKPIKEVISLFDSFENLQKWQPTLKRWEHLEGTPGQAGARTKLIYDERGKEVEMLETITKRDLPREFSATYEAKGVKNWISNQFMEDGAEKTIWVNRNEFKFRGIMKFFALFMKGAFPKQTLKDMNRFKEFVEKSN